MTTSRRFFANLILTSLILIFWVTRLVALDSLGYFIDESNHLWWARLAWEGWPFLAASDGRLLNVLWMAVFGPFNSAVWTSRASVVLLTVVGFAAILDLTRRSFSFRAAIIAGLLYIFLPLTFFFERMALADSLSAPFIAISIWAISRCDSTNWQSRKNLIWAVVAGIAITGAIFIKLSNLIFVCIPILAGLFLVSRQYWRPGLIWLSAMVAGCVFTLLPSAYLVKVWGQSDLGLDLLTLKTSVPLAELPPQIWQAILTVITDVTTYLPYTIWPLVLLGIALAVAQKNRMAWFLLATLGATLAVLVGRTSPAYLESRYLPVYAPFATILAGAGLARLRPQWNPVWITSGVLALLTPGILFTWQGWHAPETLPLPTDDRWQYIVGWPSGYGFKELADDVVDETTPLRLFTLDLGGQERLYGYLLGRTELVTPHIYGKNSDLTGAWLLLDRPKDDPEIAGLNLNLVEIGRYPRPGNESAIVVYRVEP